MSDRGWSTLATDTPQDADRVALQRGATNLAWTFLELVTYLKATFLSSADVITTGNLAVGADNDRSMQDAGIAAVNIIRRNASAQITGPTGYNGTAELLAPGATETPQPSAGHFRTLSGGSAAVTVAAMLEIGYVTWALPDVTLYTLDLSAYKVLGTVPSSGAHNLVFEYSGVGLPEATWKNQ